MMRSIRLPSFAGLVALVPALAIAAGEQPMVKVDCKATDEKLVFHCMFEFTGTKSHEPIEGAGFKVDAKMPAMPLARNVRTVRPEPAAGKPGTYEGRLELETLGEWGDQDDLRRAGPGHRHREDDVRRRADGDGPVQDGPFR